MTKSGSESRQRQRTLSVRMTEAEYDRALGLAQAAGPLVSGALRDWSGDYVLSLTLFASTRGTEGAFPEFTFFDCHSCHRRIYDQKDRSLTFEANPGRAIAWPTAHSRTLSVLPLRAA